MANEARGILFEAIANVALNDAVKIAGIPGEVRWNQKPAAMSIEPDFTIGTDPDQPTHVVLVTATGASRNSEMKSWRNLGELQEAKAQLPGMPTVVSLYFKSETKHGLDIANEKLYDTTVHVDKKPYFAALDAWVTANVRKPSMSRQEKLALLTQEMRVNPALLSSIQALATDLVDALQRRRSDLNPLWVLMRKDYQAAVTPPPARNTSVRRGLAKLLVIEPELRQSVYKNYSRLTGIPVSSLPLYATELGLLMKTVAGVRIVDDDIKRALGLLGPERCETTLRRAPATMSTWIDPLRDLSRVAIHVNFVEQHYQQLTDAKGLEDLLLKCYRDPAGLSGVPGDSTVWVYEIMMSLLKAQSNNLQGYGITQLAEDTGVVGFGQGGFVIPPFIQRKKALSSDHRRQLAIGLARRFKMNVSHAVLPDLGGRVKTWVIKENLEDRLIPYRNFEPLLWLLEGELQKQGKAYDGRAAYAGWINEYGGSGVTSATTPFVRVGSTLIHWKSVSNAGKVHKKKELSARARNVRYQYVPGDKTFVRRPGVNHLALIVDGTFEDTDLATLARAGWDMIVYPDQIPKLVQQL